MKTFAHIIWTIVKIIFKLLVILLWGMCRLSELILQQVGAFLQYLVNKPYRTQFK